MKLTKEEITRCYVGFYDYIYYKIIESSWVHECRFENFFLTYEDDTEDSNCYIPLSRFIAYITVNNVNSMWTGYKRPIFNGYSYIGEIEIHTTHYELIDIEEVTTKLRYDS